VPVDADHESLTTTMHCRLFWTATALLDAEVSAIIASNVKPPKIDSFTGASVAILEQNTPNIVALSA
jgi:hypothetical protein